MRACGRKCPGHGRRRKPTFLLRLLRAIGLSVGWVTGVSQLKQAAAPKVLLHPPQRVLEHLTNLTRLKMAEPDPDELLVLLLALSAVEKNHVHMGTEPQVGSLLSLQAPQRRVRSRG